MLAAVRCLYLVLVGAIAVFGCAGTYATSGRGGGSVDRGETNGRRFDFVSNKPEQADWQIRITGNAMWVSYARDETADKLGTISLTDDENDKVWQLIDALDLPHRKRGKKDEDEGYVSLQLKELGDDDRRALHLVTSRAPPPTRRSKRSRFTSRI